MVLDAADALELQRVLCVGPAVAGVSWPQQLAAWSPARRFVRVGVDRVATLNHPGFYFVSYDILSQQRNANLLAKLASCWTWDALVLDEAQYLKNPGANRTQAIYGRTGTAAGGCLANNAIRVWALSGTLTPNHAGEAYPHLRALFPAALQAIPAFKGRVPEQFEFEDHFCDVRDTVYGRAIQGSKNQRELRAAIAPHVLRRRKAEVMPELPAMEWFTAPVAMAPDVVEDIYQDAIRSAGLAASGAMGIDDLADVLASDPCLATQRRSLGLAKVQACAEWVRERLDAGEPKVIVFAHHTAVLDGLRDALLDYSPVVFAGSTSPSGRDAAVRVFQNDPACRVFIGQITAAGTAITLTAAKTVFFAEYAGTPGVNYQAASRAHRMGQRDGVQVYLGAVPGSLDDVIARTAARRAREIAELFD